ncbi:MAG: YIP1 family protein [Anaerolineaceae bacterium]|jgi:hypothetical protein|nr:MAG: YIP1 family protein [Anaerolineaceae bacterium]
MEQMPSNDPIMESKPGPAGWFQVWVTALTKPNEQTFIDLTESPNATSKTAFIWVFIAGTIASVFQSILQAIYAATGTTPQLPIPGLEEYTQSVGTGSVGSALIGICFSPIAGVIAVLFFALFVAVIQWVAKLFGGSGTFDKMTYAFAAISVPFTLISAVLTLFNAIPYVGLCTGLISFGVGIYALVLQVMAVKGVNRFGWGQAIGSIFIPWLVILLFCCCIVFGLSMLLGPVIGDVFQGMQFAP